MIRHKREIEDESDEQLICTGWTMVGLTLWIHPKFDKLNFTKTLALAEDVSDVHAIEMEHRMMIDTLRQLSDNGVGKMITYSVQECIDNIRKLLTNMNYI